MLGSFPKSWTRHCFYRTERTRTTWKLRFCLMAVAASTMWLASGRLASSIGRSLLCDASVATSDAILVENFDPDYLLFERARQLRRAGFSSRVLVPVYVNPGTQEPNEVALGIAEVMARVSRVGPIEVLPTHHVEPISLNTARDIQRFLDRHQIRSVIVVTPLFRSRRSELVYDATLGAAGIAVSCQPVRGTRDVDTWTNSWHGIQDVGQQWLKLVFYRVWVLPFAPVD